MRNLVGGSERLGRVAGLVLLVSSLAILSGCRRSTLPAALSDREFWSLIEALSEPPGEFSLSDNVVSNEPYFAEVVRRLGRTGGAYIGVGPEQNFSYIARVRPAIAFIVDIRRENLDLHLLYKALFELSDNRAEFVSRLFSRPLPAALGTASSVDEIFEQFEAVRPSTELLDRTAVLVRERLLATRGFPLSAADLEWIDRALKVFFTEGPKIDYYGARPVDTIRPSYRQLMSARDLAGQHRSFLATEVNFRFLKGMHTRNVIVPVVGDFGGPSAMRRVGDYVRDHRDQIYALYGSNVAVYLTNQQSIAFCRSLATMPLSSRGWYIESGGMRSLSSKLNSCPMK